MPRSFEDTHFCSFLMFHSLFDSRLVVVETTSLVPPTVANHIPCLQMDNEVSGILLFVLVIVLLKVSNNGRFQHGMTFTALAVVPGTWNELHVTSFALERLHLLVKNGHGFLLAKTMEIHVSIAFALVPIVEYGFSRFIIGFVHLALPLLNFVKFFVSSTLVALGKQGVLFLCAFFRLFGTTVSFFTPLVPFLSFIVWMFGVLDNGFYLCFRRLDSPS
mmetsp:Transcript_29489/g.81033  ORF Transcript_29489/g.81033 Transcript_29489/m.81033 type:complete len:218 (+) Transcript_29489:1049-1702(+)